MFNVKRFFTVSTSIQFLIKKNQIKNLILYLILCDSYKFKEYSKFKKGKKGKIYIHIDYNLLNIIRSFFRIYKKKDEYFGENHHNLLI